MERVLGFDRRIAWALVVVLVAASFVFVFFVLPPLVVPSDVDATEAERIKLRNDVRSAATQFLGGLALVTGLLFTARTLRLNREGQLTDRFSKAIDQLGDERLDVRLGGIYALERIARDSERDHGPVMEVLTAYVRRYKRSERDGEEDAPYDVQAIMTVVGRRKVSGDPQDSRLDLRGADLRHIQIRGGDFRSVWLNNVELDGARFTSCDFAGASLAGAQAGNALFFESNLAGSYLVRADLARAHFIDTSLEAAEYDAETRWGQRDPEAYGATLQQPP